MKILVVEDEHKIAHALKKGLEHERYIVDVVYDGKNGFDLAVSEEFDLIILDIMLPEMDGITLCKKLREQKIHTPILMLTAKGQISDRVAGLDSGADDYLVKPFAFVELFARVRALIRRPREAVSELLTVADLSIDTRTFSVKRGDTAIALSNKEFSLLVYLVRYKGQIVSKEKLLTNVWEYDSDVLPNSVEVYIKHLRDKIDKPFPQRPSLFHTIRGFGYKISL
jgi:two-component system, OmpR family, response regulator